MNIAIIKHNSPGDYFSYDVLAKNGAKLVDRDGNEIDGGYDAPECEYVKEFLLENSEYEYLFSDDMGHIQGWNWIEGEVNRQLLDNKAILIDKTK